MEIIGLAVGLIAVGLFIGVASGMLGIGGGTIIVPVLRLVFGLSAFMATATSLFTIVFTSASGVVAHLRNKTCIVKLGLALGLGGSLTSAAGASLQKISPSWLIMVVAAIIILYSGYNMLKKALALPKPSRSSVAAADGGCAEKKPVNQQIDQDEFELTNKKLAIGFGIGIVAGLASGYVGVGGGFIMVPLMTSWLGVSMRNASGTSLLAIIILVIPGIIGHAMAGNIDYMAGLLISVGSIPGAFLGAKIQKHVPERMLRFLFAGFLAVGAVLLVLKEFGILG